MSDTHSAKHVVDELFWARLNRFGFCSFAFSGFWSDCFRVSVVGVL